MRVTLPVTVFVVGVILVILGGEIAQGAGIFLIGSAVLGALANAYMRLGLQSNADREREEARRSSSKNTGAGRGATRSRARNWRGAGPRASYRSSRNARTSPAADDRLAAAPAARCNGHRS